MRSKLRLLVVCVAFTCLCALVASGKLRDLWIHPRGESYDPKLHYRAPDGELFFHAENELGKGLEKIVVGGGPDPRVTAKLGADLRRFVAKHGGSLVPVVLYDSNGDGRVDRTLRGVITDQTAVFDGARVADVDWRARRWQMGIRYEAGATGLAKDDRRYLASVEGESARVEFPDVATLPPVSAPPAAPPGLEIFLHRAGRPFELAPLASGPDPFLADFIQLTAEPDADAWTAKQAERGLLRTRLDGEQLFLVRARGGATLGVVWGDMPLEPYLRERLGVAPAANGCLSSEQSALEGDDGAHAPVPIRILYCPQAAFAVFDAPPGYEIGLTARLGETTLAYTEASTSIVDNLRLYGRQVYPRSPNTRATASLSGNLRASFADGGQDVLDMGRHLVTGTARENIHTGQLEQRTSLLAAVPMLVIGVARLEPVQGGKDFFEGIQSGVQVAADAVSATNNAVINPLLQVTLGAASLEAADDAGHLTGAVTQTWAKNLPGSERSMDALNPMSLWYHDRGFKPTAYTRTDTQLNIDRIVSLANIFGVYGLTPLGGVAGGGGGGGVGGGSPPPVTPPPATPPPVVVPGC